MNPDACDTPTGMDKPPNMTNHALCGIFVSGRRWLKCCNLPSGVSLMAIVREEA